MSVGDRIKVLRSKLELTQADFAERLGTARNTIANYEIGRREPKEQTIKSICREFNVDYIWLTSGIGEMFTETDNQAQTMIDRIMFGENEFAKRVFKAFAAFDESDWKTLEKFIDAVAERGKGKKKEAD